MSCCGEVLEEILRMKGRRADSHLLNYGRRIATRVLGHQREARGVTDGVRTDELMSGAWLIRYAQHILVSRGLF